MCLIMRHVKKSSAIYLNAVKNILKHARSFFKEKAAVTKWFIQNWFAWLIQNWVLQANYFLI